MLHLFQYPPFQLLICTRTTKFTTCIHYFVYKTSIFKKGDYMNQLEMYTHLFAHKMILEKLNPSINEQEFNRVISKAHFEISNGIPLDVNDVERLFSKELAPQMNQLIPKLLQYGFAPNYLADYFKVTRAAISFNKSHTSNKDYVNIILKDCLTTYQPEYKEFIEEHTGNRIIPNFKKYVYKR